MLAIGKDVDGSCLGDVSTVWMAGFVYVGTNATGGGIKRLSQLFSSELKHMEQVTDEFVLRKHLLMQFCNIVATYISSQVTPRTTKEVPNVGVLTVISVFKDDLQKPKPDDPFFKEEDYDRLKNQHFLCLTDIDDFYSLRVLGQGFTQEGQFIKRKDAWKVRGHWRIYSDGKRVWVKPHVRGRKAHRYKPKGKDYRL